MNKQKHCRFCEKSIEYDNVTQKENNFIPPIHRKFSYYDCHMFFKNLVDMKSDELNFDIIPKANEECLSVTYGCIKFIGCYRFLSTSLDAFFRKFE